MQTSGPVPGRDATATHTASGSLTAVGELAAVATRSTSAECTERLDPPLPLRLRQIAVSFPNQVRQLVLLEDHRVRAAPTKHGEPLFSVPKQRRADALTTPARSDSQPIEVTPPAVPTRDSSADQLAVFFGESQRVGVALQQAL